MKRLNQVVAVERDAKKNAYSDISKEHHLLQKPELVSGISRTYKPLRDDGEVFPAESKLVQTRVTDVLQELQRRYRDFWDVTLTRDIGNQSATADILLPNGEIVATGVPVSTLLFLEKQLSDMHTFLGKLPTLPTDETWTFDAAKGYYVSPPTQTHKTAKVQKPIVLYQATVEHPAQTQLITEDVTIGHWTTVKHSGAIPVDRKRELVERCERLLAAVKDARERANMIEVSDMKMADAIFSKLLG